MVPLNYCLYVDDDCNDLDVQESLISLKEQDPSGVFFIIENRKNGEYVCGTYDCHMYIKIYDVEQELSDDDLVAICGQFCSTDDMVFMRNPFIPDLGVRYGKVRYMVFPPIPVGVQVQL